MTKLTSIQNPLKSLHLCSRCLSHEINSWTNEKWKDLDEEVKRQINEELKTIKLRPGECIVCKNTLVSMDTAERILEILKENKVKEEVIEEFESFFLLNKKLEENLKKDNSL